MVKKKTKIDKEAIEKALRNKKMQKFEWKDDELVAIICPDGTRFEIKTLKVK